MRGLKKRFRFRPSREFIGLGVVLILIVAGVWLGFREKVSLSPNIDFSQPGVTLKFNFSDHSGSGLLANDLNDPTDADYSGAQDTPELLRRDGNGNVPDLFRIQAEIDYK